MSYPHGHPFPVQNEPDASSSGAQAFPSLRSSPPNFAESQLHMSQAAQRGVPEALLLPLTQLVNSDALSTLRHLAASGASLRDVVNTLGALKQFLAHGYTLQDVIRLGDACNKRASVASQSTLSSFTDSLWSEASHRTSMTTISSTSHPQIDNRDSTASEMFDPARAFEPFASPAPSGSSPSFFNTYFSMPAAPLMQQENPQRPERQAQIAMAPGSASIDLSQRCPPIASNHSSPSMSLGSPSEIYNTPGSGVDINTPEAIGNFAPIKTAPSITCPFAHQGCLKTYAKPGHLENHLKLKHKEEECRFCGGCRSVYSQRHFAFHPEACRNAAESSPAWGCKQCDQYFPSANALATHVSRDIRHTDNAAMNTTTATVGGATSDRSLQDSRSGQADPQTLWSEYSSSPVGPESVDRTTDLSHRPILRIPPAAAKNRPPLSYMSQSPIHLGSAAIPRSAGPTSQHADHQFRQDWPLPLSVSEAPQIIPTLDLSTDPFRQASIGSVRNASDWDNDFVHTLDTIVDTPTSTSSGFASPTIATGSSFTTLSVAGSELTDESTLFPSPHYTQLSANTHDDLPPSPMDAQPSHPTLFFSPPGIVSNHALATPSLPSASHHQPGQNLEPPPTGMKRKARSPLNRLRRGRLDETAGHQVESYSLPFVEGNSENEQRVYEMSRRNVFKESYPCMLEENKNEKEERKKEK